MGRLLWGVRTHQRPSAQCCLLSRESRCPCATGCLLKAIAIAEVCHPRQGAVFHPFLVSLSLSLPGFCPPGTALAGGRCRKAEPSREHSLREIIDFGSASYEIWEENKRKYVILQP